MIKMQFKSSGELSERFEQRGGFISVEVYKVQWFNTNNFEMG